MSLESKRFDFDFEKSVSFEELKSGTVFQIKEYDVFNTKYGVLLGIEDTEGKQYHTYSEVIVPKFVKSLNTGVRLQKRVVKFEVVESGYDTETGEIISYFNLLPASSNEVNEFQLALRNKRKEALKKHRENQKQNQEATEENQE